MQEVLNSQQLEGLRARFPHFNEARCSPLLHLDQDGKATVGGREYPAVLLRNGCRLLYDRKNRPKQKTLAPHGERALLATDATLAGEEWVLVEGEGDLLALASIGCRRVACLGGTEQVRRHAPKFRGKRVVLLFDADDAGRRGARAFALAALQCGATSVAIAELPEGQDPESLSAAEPTPDDALAKVQEVLGKAKALTQDEVRRQQSEQDEKDGFRLVPTWVGREGDALLVTVWEPDMERTELAVYGPLDFGEDAASAGPYPGKEPEPEPELRLGWRLLEEGLRLPERKAVLQPGGRDDLLELVREGSLTVPPRPPKSTPTPEELWGAVHDYLAEWLHATDVNYHVLTAYVHACWALEDAQFQKAPFLRIHGASNSGKTRTVELVHSLGNMSLYASMSPSNVHRVVESFREFTMCWDEFNPENMPREEAKALVNTMNYSQNRQSRVLRMIPGAKKGSDMQVKAFRVFGPKVFCGYLDSEDDGFRRRTVEVNMDALETPVPTAKLFSQLPPRAMERARELRGQLLQWRVANLDRGPVDPETDHAHRFLVGERVTGMLDAYWPLFWVLPSGAEQAQASLLSHAKAAEGRWKANRHTKAEAFILEAVSEALRAGSVFRSDHHPAVGVQELLDHCREGLPWLDLRKLSKILKELGVHPKRVRLYSRSGEKCIARRSAVVLDDAGMRAFGEAAKAHGVEWDSVDANQEAGC